MKCKQCKKTITGEYIEVDGDIFHPQCFLCYKCKKPIEGNYYKFKNHFYHLQCHREATGLICAACGKVLVDKWVEQNGKKYHPSCLDNRCDICDQSMTGSYLTDKDGRKYHEACYLKQKAPRCCICDSPITGKYMIDPWGNTAHHKHNGKKIETCSYCSRIMSYQSSNGGFKYSDGRVICGICKLSAVNDNRQIRRSLQKVLQLLGSSSAKFTDIPYNVPVQLVDKPMLRHLSGGLFDKLEQGFTQSNITKQNNKRIKVDYRIFILFGLPQITFESVLAHELLHVWLIEKDARLSNKETEGFCNLGAALTLQSEDSDFARYLLKKMAENPDRIYGEGYRKMNRKLQRYGWYRLKSSL